MGQRFHPESGPLDGAFVRLEPLGSGHAADLFRCGQDASIWRYMPDPPFQTEGDAASWIDRAVAARGRGDQYPFAAILKSNGHAVGSTRYLTIRPEHRSLEIGYTWLTPAAQRSAVNTECKLLLLTYAFDAMGAVRVEFKTDERNERSQKALERIGAVREGILRRHMILWDGFIRNSVYYSILDGEWPRVRSLLGALLARGSE